MKAHMNSFVHLWFDSRRLSPQLNSPSKSWSCEHKSCILNEWLSLSLNKCVVEAVEDFIPLKVQRVFLSYNVVRVSSHYLRFYHHINARQLSNRSIFHAGRYLDDKEIGYLRTVRVTANVCHSRNELRNTGHISVLKYRHLELNLVYLLYSRLINIIVIPKLDKWLAKFFTLVKDEHECEETTNLYQSVQWRYGVLYTKSVVWEIILRR